MKKEIQAVCMYNGHSIKQTGSIDLKLKMKYEELVNSVQLLQMLNNDVKVTVRMPNQKKAIQLGLFRIKSLTVDHDGESMVAFNSTNDFVEVDNLNTIVTKELFRVTFKAEIEEESEGDEEDWDEEEDNE